MKKIFRSLLAVAIAATTFTACEDVPAPYDIPGSGEQQQQSGTLPYTSANLNTGWTLHSITAEQPWSQGSSYTQATGYQKWDGSSDKSNRAVEGWLISPVINTTGYENVKISFNQTIRYTNNVSGWEAYHKVYASNNYDGTNFDDATWTELDYKPVASPYSDWTLYPSGDIQLPAEMVNQPSVYIGFWFKAPANASTTWELTNFKAEEGIAENTEDKPAVVEGVGTEDEPLTVTQAIAKGTGTGAWVKGYIVGALNTDPGYKAVYTPSAVTIASNILIAASADETDSTKCMPVQLPTGDIRSALNLKDNPGVHKQEVTFYANIETYFQLPGLKSVSYAKLGDKSYGNKPGETPETGEAKGTGTQADPFNAAGAAKKAGELATGATSSESYYIKGKISSIKYSFSADYGTATFYISDDGTSKEQFYIYGAYYLGNRAWKNGDTQIALGDEVIIYGKLANYNGTLETANKENFIYSLNGKTEGGSDAPDDPTPSDEPGNVGQVDGNTVTFTADACGFEDKGAATSVTLVDGTKIVFDKAEGSTAPAYYGGTYSAIRIYAKNTITVTASKKIASIAITTTSPSGSTKYNGNDTAYAEGSTKVSISKDSDTSVSFSGLDAKSVKIVNENEKSSGGTQLRIASMTITYAE